MIEYALYRPKGTAGYQGPEITIIDDPAHTLGLVALMRQQGVYEGVKIIERDVSEWRDWDGTS
jgi:hypothetical protein